MEQIKVLLADDQTLFVESLRVVLQKLTKDIRVVGVARNGREALKLTSELHPNIVLMDVRLTEMNGVETARMICETYPDIKVLMLTTLNDSEYVIKTLGFGAVGYLLKSVSPVDLIAAIRGVSEGNVLIAPKVAFKLLKKLMGKHKERSNVDITINSPDWIEQLSKREKEVLGLIAQGYNNKEIAKKLYIGEQTVRNYVSIIYCKLGVKDRVLVAKMANKANLG